MEDRGKLVRQLNELNNPRLLLIRKFEKEDGEYLSDDNQIIFADQGYKLLELEKYDDFNLGLIFINEDIAKGPTNFIGINGRILYLRPNQKKQLIRPNGRTNYGTLIAPHYQLEKVYFGSGEILDYCKKQGIKRKNLKKRKNW